MNFPVTILRATGDVFMASLRRWGWHAPMKRTWTSPGGAKIRDGRITLPSRKTKRGKYYG